MIDDALQVAGQVVTLRSVLEDRLRTAILTGRFAPGQRLPERELCELTGASRASVREALRQLSAEGLVVIQPHRGPSVAAITEKDASELYSLRGVLMGYAARLFAQSRPPAALAAMHEAVEALAQAAKRDDVKAIVLAGDAFHDAIAEGCGHGVLRQTLQTLHNRIALLRNMAMARPARVRQGLAAYRRIAAAIEAGEAGQAEAISIRHCEAGWDTARHLFTPAGVPAVAEAKAQEPETA
ncbi:GntR family transcriptional regulator [Acetobacteraceae bacterium H6797]|nr:GntR family transcriptional regulator [Acetobacteraceae bacterium H6797]